MTTAAIPTDYFHQEDIEIGRVMSFGARRVTELEIIAFAKVYDPQPMHTDAVAAKSTVLGRLCASGYHTTALMMRILCDAFILRSASLGSPGIESCKWLKPVFPGDVLSVDLVATDARVLASRPDVGVSRMLFTTRNQTGDAVMEMVSNQMMRLRQPQSVASTRRSDGSSATKTPKAADVDLWAQHPEPLPEPRPSGLFLEDRRIGETVDLGAHTFERAEIIAFATEFDPQPFHLDEAAGKASLFGGLSASGWHTAAIHLKLLLAERDARLARARDLGLAIAETGPSPGFNALKWLKPVLTGDTIRFRTQTVGLRPLASNPKRGLVTTLSQGRNQHDKIVFSVEGQVFVDRRHWGQPS